jgi:predicted MFS family arabinose efflux permease
MQAFARLSPEVRQYLIVTGNYWAFTLTDGALRMLVVLHFHSLGYTPLQIAALFLFYEVFGVVTNLVGGYLGARLGLNRTMNLGLAMQVVALLMLTVPAAWLTVPWVMGAQALSGIAKDLNKMSAKSSIKLLVPDSQQGTLYKWVAILTGSKNALKGVVNSSLHSYLIVSYAKEDGVSLDVGFYYMSNAMGRLIGTLLSGWVFQAYGLQACLWVSSLFVLLAAIISLRLPRHTR